MQCQIKRVGGGDIRHKLQVNTDEQTTAREKTHRQNTQEADQGQARGRDTKTRQEQHDT